MDNINIYSCAWDNDPKKKGPDIQSILDALENIQLEHVYLNKDQSHNIIENYS